VKKVNIPNQKIIAIELWDLPAHEDFDMNKSYFQNADAAIGDDHDFSNDLLFIISLAIWMPVYWPYV